MKRRLPILLALILAGAAGAAAQDYFFTNFRFGHVDYELPTQPCGEVGFLSVQLWGYQTSAWASYTCNDPGPNKRVIERRFFHPNDTVTPPAPTVDRCAQYPGFVPAIGPDGCVPPDHPLAAK